MKITTIYRRGFRLVLVVSLVLAVQGSATAQQTKKTLHPPKTTTTAKTPVVTPVTPRVSVADPYFLPGVSPFGPRVQSGQPFTALNGKGQPMFAGTQGMLMTYTGGIYGPLGPFSSSVNGGPGYGGVPYSVYGYSPGYASSYGGSPYGGSPYGSSSFSGSPGVWGGNPYMPGSWSGFPSPFGY